MALCPGLPRSAGTKKVKLIWILLKQQTASGSGISWAICHMDHASTSLLSFLQAGCPSCRPTNSIKALKAVNSNFKYKQCSADDKKYDVVQCSNETETAEVGLKTVRR